MLDDLTSPIEPPPVFVIRNAMGEQIGDLIFDIVDANRRARRYMKPVSVYKQIGLTEIPMGYHGPGGYRGSPIR